MKSFFLPRIPSILWFVLCSSPRPMSVVPPLKTLDMLDTLGALFLSQMESSNKVMKKNRNYDSIDLFTFQWYKYSKRFQKNVQENYKTYLYQFFSNFPTEDSWVVFFIFFNFLFHFWCSNSRFGSTYYSWSNRTSFLLKKNSDLKRTWIHLLFIQKWFSNSLSINSLPDSDSISLKHNHGWLEADVKWHMVWHQPLPFQWS